MCWVICEGVPFCLATERIRPASESEVLAYQYQRDQTARIPGDVQQSYIDESALPEDENDLEGDDLPELEESESDAEKDDDGGDDSQVVVPIVMEPDAEEVTETASPEAVKRRAEVMDDFPAAALRRTELRAEEPVDSTLEPTELRASSSRPSRSRSPKRSDQVESYDLERLEECSSLFDMWGRNNVTGTGVEIFKNK